MKWPEYSTLLLRPENEHVLVVTLNRPEVLNAINTQMGRDLLDLGVDSRKMRKGFDAWC